MITTHKRVQPKYESEMPEGQEHEVHKKRKYRLERNEQEDDVNDGTK